MSRSNRPKSVLYSVLYLVLALYPLLNSSLTQAQELDDSSPVLEPEVFIESPAASAPWEGHRLYADVEYVLWWLREGRLPPVLTTSSAASGGVFGQPDTQVLYGGDRLETRHGDRFNGTRLTLGCWFDPQQTIGIEGRAVVLERDSTSFKATSDGSQLLARPFIDAVTGTPMSDIVAGPGPNGVLSGGFVGYSRIEMFTEEINLVGSVAQGPSFGLDLLAGARFVQMRDRTDLTATGKLLPTESTIFGLSDHYLVFDKFYGGQLGVRGHYLWNRWRLGFRGTVALGSNDERVSTFGDSLVATPTSRVETPVGLTVLPSNSGTFSRTVFNTIYEVDLDIGYRLSNHWKVYAGYTLFLWASPIRSGDQVELDINPSQLTGPLAGPALPGIPFKEDFFWAQGLNLGLAFSW
jgi:hypothetical protein